MMKTFQLNRSLPKSLIAGGSAVVAAGLMMDLYGLPSLNLRQGINRDCQQIVRSEARLTKEQLARLLVIPEGSNQQSVREIVQEPHCKLSSLQVRVGATAQREAYPLEFDSNTRLIVLYEGDQYAGYRFDSH
jgi:hypothetical protein